MMLGTGQMQGVGSPEAEAYAQLAADIEDCFRHWQHAKAHQTGLVMALQNAVSVADRASRTVQLPVAEEPAES